MNLLRKAESKSKKLEEEIKQAFEKEEELEKLRKRVMNVDPTLNEKYGLKIKELEDVKNENHKLNRTV